MRKKHANLTVCLSLRSAREGLGCGRLPLLSSFPPLLRPLRAGICDQAQHDQRREKVKNEARQINTIEAKTKNKTRRRFDYLKFDIQLFVCHYQCFINECQNKPLSDHGPHLTLVIICSVALTDSLWVRVFITSSLCGPFLPVSHYIKLERDHNWDGWPTGCLP